MTYLQKSPSRFCRHNLHSLSPFFSREGVYLSPFRHHRPRPTPARSRPTPINSCPSDLGAPPPSPTSVQSLPHPSIRSAHYKPRPPSTLTNADFLTVDCIEEGENFDLCGGAAARGGDAWRPTADMAVQEAATLTDGSEQATGPRMPDAGRHGWLPSTTSTPARSAFGRSIWSAWRWRGRLLRGRQAEGRWRRHNSSSFPSSTQPLSSMSRIPKEYLPSNSNRDGAEQTGPRRAEFMWNTGCRWSKQQQQHVSAALVAPITARKMEWLCCGPGQRVVPSGLEVAAAVRKGGRGSRPKGIVVV